ncbi:MAG: hydantoinase/oxoprolinase family protein [Gammaproteobacteria bacterium]|nr:hydantoinase/oxoprolinase family protein [Gammaproteobacteria bacterium]MDE0414950.1 hydantoinase/oxoprolinase family protein [Gammaproteobacteria bacterium]
MTQYRVSADIGGTFTDMVVEPSDGAAFVDKVPTTPENPARGVVEAVRRQFPDPSAVEFFVHGTTVGINAFLERKGERVLLITTAGHRDGYTIARGNRQALYELRYRKPELLVPRRDVHEVRGRIAWDGRVIEELNEGDFEPIIRKATAEEVRAIAVCFLHAHIYPGHELEARRILRAALPDVSVSLSHEVAKEWREYERASSAVMNAYVAPVVERYLASLQGEFADMGMSAPVHVMQSNGGVISAETARRSPVFTLLSGPVGGTIAGTALAAGGGRKNLLCVDMGGTSFDLSLVIDGRASKTLETELEGLPLLMSVVDIQTIGTGGGSIAWLEHGAMRVGPQSAGSVPGPACYGRGGVDPTVTDANLYLGRLGEHSLLSGEMKLDLAASEQAIERVAGEAGLDPQSFAEGILAISNAAMADAMRTITVSQGVDPRDFTLVAFGGAGPMAAAFLAAELDIGEVLIPRFPGTFSAWGMLQTDLRRDLTKSFYRQAQSVSVDELEVGYADLEEEGRQALKREDVSLGDMSFRRSADMRYVGQEYTINARVRQPMELKRIVKAFHSAHQRRYGHSSASAPVEFVNLRIAALGALKKCRQDVQLPASDGRNALSGHRDAVFDGKRQRSGILSRDHLPESFQSKGPVIVEERSATTVVPPGWQVSVEAQGNLLLDRRGAP